MANTKMSKHKPAAATVQQNIRQFFELPGVAHEPAYKNPLARQLTVYAIAKIAASLPLPTQITARKA